jgi:hypothetical protein
MKTLFLFTIIFLVVAVEVSADKLTTFILENEHALHIKEIPHPGTAAQN